MHISVISAGSLTEEKEIWVNDKEAVLSFDRPGGLRIRREGCRLVLLSVITDNTVLIPTVNTE